jgi:hypothetical protein
MRVPIMLNDFMEQSHSDATSRLATEEFTDTLWSPKVNYRVRKSPNTGLYNGPDETKTYFQLISLTSI